jgi:hypothetical protein
MSLRRYLWLSVAVLSMVLALEAMPSRTWRLPAADAAVGSPLRVSLGQETASAEAQAKARADSVEMILARPVFSPSRRPEAKPSEAAVAEAPAPPAVPLPRLTGVVTSPSERLALFASSGGKVMELVEGESIGNYVVRSISPSEVILSGPDGERMLRPSLLRIVPHVIHALQEASAQ